VGKGMARLPTPCSMAFLDPRLVRGAILPRLRHIRILFSWCRVFGGVDGRMGLLLGWHNLIRSNMGQSVALSEMLSFPSYWTSE